AAPRDRSAPMLKASMQLGLLLHEVHFCISRLHYTFSQDTQDTVTTRSVGRRITTTAADVVGLFPLVFRGTSNVTACKPTCGVGSRLVGRVREPSSRSGYAASAVRSVASV